MPIYWIGGRKVADDYADFYDGTWDSYDGVSEGGDDYSAKRMWTGSNYDGTIGTYYAGRSGCEESSTNHSSDPRYGRGLCPNVTIGALRSYQDHVYLERGETDPNTGRAVTQRTLFAVYDVPFNPRIGRYGGPLDVGQPEESQKEHRLYALSPVYTVNGGSTGNGADPSINGVPGAPAKPTGFSAMAGSPEVTLTWADPGDAGIIGYHYRQMAVGACLERLDGHPGQRAGRGERDVLHGARPDRRDLGLPGARGERQGPRPGVVPGDGEAGDHHLVRDADAATSSLTTSAAVTAPAGGRASSRRTSSTTTARATGSSWSGGRSSARSTWRSPESPAPRSRPRSAR